MKKKSNKSAIESSLKSDKLVSQRAQVGNYPEWECVYTSHLELQGLVSSGFAPSPGPILKYESGAEAEVGEPEEEEKEGLEDDRRRLEIGFYGKLKKVFGRQPDGAMLMA